MAQISDKKLTQLQRAAEAGKKARARITKEAKVAMDGAVRTGTVMGSAFGMGYVEARYPDKAKVFGIDVSLLVGVGATTAGVFGWAGDQQSNTIVEGIGIGALAHFAAKKGAQMGSEAANEAA